MAKNIVNLILVPKLLTALVGITEVVSGVGKIDNIGLKSQR